MAQDHDRGLASLGSESLFYFEGVLNFDVGGSVFSPDFAVRLLLVCCFFLISWLV